MTTINVYDEIAGFMANMNPVQVVSFKPSQENQDRFDFLLSKNSDNEISSDEKKELEHYLIINRIISLAKARAFNLLQS